MIGEGCKNQLRLLYSRVSGEINLVLHMNLYTILSGFNCILLMFLYRWIIRS